MYPWSSSRYWCHQAFSSASCHISTYGFWSSAITPYTSSIVSKAL
ncbi:hypothetical protein [Lentzea albida]|nr:hypothetical protein [Lentzea albida]